MKKKLENFHVTNPIQTMINFRFVDSLSYTHVTRVLSKVD